METRLIDVFDSERLCEYKGRTYRVRDNGAIMRLPKEGCRKSRLDEVWTFGTKDPTSGYMLFASSVRVHQVECTAFNGPEPQPHMVVDHVDNNRCNNRPENLRWLTRLDNALFNDVTRKKIIFLCGSIDAFLDNPAIIRTKALPPNYEWMRTVTKEEAAACRKHMEEWAARDSAQAGSGQGVGDWIYKEEIFSEEERREAMASFGDAWKNRYPFKPWRQQVAEIEEENRRLEEQALATKDSLTPGAKQCGWKTPTEFPQTPQKVSDTPLQDYLSRLSKGAVYSRNTYGDSLVLDAALSEDGSHLAVIASLTGVKNYGLSEVSFRDGAFVHENPRTFFEEVGAVKYFTLSLGREWTGGDVFDDYC